MEKEQLANFVSWLSDNVEEFEGMEPEEIVQTLNDMSQDEEGNATISQLVGQFQEESGASEGSNGQQPIFRAGGKMEFFLRKFKKGGEYNREEARGKKRKYKEDNPDMREESNVRAKRLKASEVEGFDDSMYNYDTDDLRDDYREAKREYRKNGMSRRAAKARALINVGPGTPNIDPGLLDGQGPRGIEIVDPGPWSRREHEIVIGPITPEIIPDPKPVPIPTIPDDPTPAPATREKYEYKPMSYNQFATYLFKYLKKTGAVTGGVDGRSIEAYMNMEYNKYTKQGLDYKLTLPKTKFNTFKGDPKKLIYHNENASNWGNVDRSGELFGDRWDTSKTVRERLNAKGVNTDYVEVPQTYEQSQKQKDARWVNNTPQGLDESNTSNYQMFGNDQTYDLGPGIAGTALKAVARVPGTFAAFAVPGLGLGAGLAGFATQYLNGSLTDQAIASEMERRQVSKNWLTQGFGQEYHPGGAGGGGTYVNNGKFAHVPTRNSRLLNYDSILEEGVPGTQPVKAVKGLTGKVGPEEVAAVLEGDGPTTRFITGMKNFGKGLMKVSPGAASVLGPAYEAIVNSIDAANGRSAYDLNRANNYTYFDLNDDMNSLQQSNGREHQTYLNLADVTGAIGDAFGITHHKNGGRIQMKKLR